MTTYALRTSAMAAIFAAGIFAFLGLTNATVVHAANPVTVSTTTCTNLSSSLSYGSTDGRARGQVTLLQRHLSTLGYYSGPITGYFGRLTETAVKKYQVAKSIVTPGAIGHGSVGPKTRAWLIRECGLASTGTHVGTGTPTSTPSSGASGGVTWSGGGGGGGGYSPQPSGGGSSSGGSGGSTGGSTGSGSGSGSGSSGATTGTTGTTGSTSSATPVTPAPVPPPPPPPPPPNPPTVTVTPGTFSIAVLGNHFVDSNGTTVVPRGVNFSGFEGVPLQGWSPGDPSGAQAGQPGGPKWSAVKTWNANIVRIPLNEASWLGYTCVDTNGASHNPDPGANYRSAVATQVAQANAAGLYVILDLHWAAPGNACPMLQNQMADADHSIDFWTSVASIYKNNPGVMFELFNEPFLNFDFSGNQWTYLMKGTGGSFSGYPATSNSGAWKDVKSPWNIASYQAMLDAVRATGAKNVVLIGTLDYSKDLSGWLTNKPVDPAGQIAAVWHPYPAYGTTWGTASYAQPNYAPGVYTDIQNILAAGIPVLATETGDKNTAGTVGAPFVATITAFADQNNIGIVGWTWDIWGNPSNVLIKDVNGTPTDGYGVFFKNWLTSKPTWVPNGTASTVTVTPGTGSTGGSTASTTPSPVPPPPPPPPPTPPASTGTSNISFVGSSAVVGGGTTLTVTKPSGVSSGDRLFVSIEANNAAASITLPADWTLVSVAGTDASIASPIFSRVYTKVAGASEPASYVFKFAGYESPVATMIALRGVTSVAAVGNASANYATLPAIATNAPDGAWLLYFIDTGNGGHTPTAPSGMTIPSEVLTAGAGTYNGAYVAYQGAVAAGSYSKQGSLGGERVAAHLITVQ